MMHPAAIDRREAYRNAEAQERRDREAEALLIEAARQIRAGYLAKMRRIALDCRGRDFEAAIADYVAAEADAWGDADGAVSKALGLL